MLVFLLASFARTLAQDIRINEVAPVNVSVLDEDGDTPDWFELYNYGAETINLNGWSLSDKQGDSLEWEFPDISLGPDQYMLLWASGKDRKTIGFPRTFVAPGDQVRYILPVSEPDASWREIGFDDTGWTKNITGIGYGDGDDETSVPNGTITVFLRKEFQLSSKAEVMELILDIDYDDAFVAYINGVEIARSGINNYPPAYNQTASIGHEANLYRGMLMERFPVANPQAILNDGPNVLSIQAHNISSNSSDMSIIPALSALFGSPQSDGITPPEVLNLRNQYLHTNFRLASAGETIYLYNNQQLLVDSLRTTTVSGEITLGKEDNSGNLYYYDTPTPGFANANNYLGLVQSTLQFSHNGGPSSPLTLSLSGTNAAEEIRFTLDGTAPNASSSLYSTPLSITQTTVVKARIFKQGFLPSTIETRTYIIGETHQVPVVSLTFDHDDFFHPVDGMYVLGEDYSGDIPYFGSNIWEEWERPVNFEFYETDGTLGTSIPMGARIFGGWSRANAQRSLSLFTRSGYGASSLDYPLFKNVNYASFQAIVLRNSGNDWRNTQIRDAVMTSLMQGTDLEYQDFRPTATYLNGEYWGFYNIREKINEHFLAAKSGVDPDDIDLLEFNGDIVHGSNIEYLNLLQYLQVNSLTNQANYEYVKSKVDIENYLNYLAAQIYFANTDWPGNNVKFWNHPNGKWRWILYDTDFGFGPWDDNGYYHNTLDFALETNGPGWPNPPWSTFMFRKLVQNEEFRHALINRFADLLNSRFRENIVVNHIDSISKIVEPEMARHMARWDGNIDAWAGNINRMKNFGRYRPGVLRSHIMERFGISKTLTIQTENSHPNRGDIKLNSLIIREAVWSGLYFNNVPITIKAVAREGYRFSHWSGSVDSQESQLILTPTESISLRANFVPLPENQEPIMINEINYNSDREWPTGDWLELYNPNPDAVNISNWLFKDSNDLHIFSFPELQDIAAYDYLVVCRDLSAFKELYPDVENVIGNFNFGLSSTDDMVRIFNASGELHDIVAYSSLAPWPVAPNGTGATLELLSPELDNSLAESWGVVNLFGSPGRANTLTTAVEEPQQRQIQIYPNPFGNELNVLSDLSHRNPLTIQIIDLLGSLQYEIRSSSGSTTLNLTTLARGTYVLRIIKQDGAVLTQKVIKR